ncbi:hypothetical protein HGRIS_010385 [Hohenbuehelia grisea]
MSSIPDGYVEKLADRVEKMEKLLHQLCPDLDLAEALENLDLEQERKEPDSFRSGYSTDIKDIILFPDRSVSEVALSAIRKLSTPFQIPEEGDLEYVEQPGSGSNDCQNLEGGTHGAGQYIGKSSNGIFIRDVYEIKQQWAASSFCKAPARPSSAFTSRRENFWKRSPWEIQAVVPPSPLTFPESDLLRSLVELYFQNYNLYFPFIHRPTFDRNVAEGLHLKDYSFGCLVLLVCAAASRHADDPRVLLDAESSFHSAGWKFFNQVKIIQYSHAHPVQLHDLQCFCVIQLFLQNTRSLPSCWVLTGIAIRRAQEIGAHRRLGKNHMPSVEYEQLKRVFWTLVCFDRITSLSLGRPCVVQDDDYDLDLPVECDDEYWVVHNKRLYFQQPHNKPSRVAFFNSYLQVSQMCAWALYTLYGPNRLLIDLGLVGPEWNQKLVTEMGSFLNKWHDSVPQHLRWDPNRQDLGYFHQSAALFATYHQIQLIIHGPFLPVPLRIPCISLLPSLPSLEICGQSARMIGRIAEAQTRRCGLPSWPLLPPLTTAGIVLSLIWGGRKLWPGNDVARAESDLQKCMDGLKQCETRWLIAGRMWDILHELSTTGHSSSSAGTDQTPVRQSDSAKVTTGTSVREAESSSLPYNQNVHEESSPVDSRTPSDATAPPSSPGSHSSLDFLNLASCVKSNIYGQDAFSQPEPTSFEPALLGGAWKNPLTAPTKPAEPNFFSSLGMDDGMMAMWSNAPLGFEFDQWGQFLLDAGQIINGTQPEAPSGISSETQGQQA